MNNILVGKIIFNIESIGDKTEIVFYTNEGKVVVQVEGECCSYSWVEHIELPALGFPAKVLSVEALDLPLPEQTEEYRYLEVYGCKITTDKGEIIIDYRNDSNGYYGGYLVWPQASSN